MFTPSGEGPEESLGTKMMGCSYLPKVWEGIPMERPFLTPTRLHVSNKENNNRGDGKVQEHASPAEAVSQSPPTNRVRRHDIDWLRVILFALLIWFHYAVFSLYQLEGKESSFDGFNIVLFFVIGVMHQWRLGALYVISGMGTAFAFRRRTWQTYLKERGSRLGIPLLFATYILWFGIFSPVKTTRLLFTVFPGS